MDSALVERRGREILYFPDHKSTSWEKTLISCGVHGEDEGILRPMVILGKPGIWINRKEKLPILLLLHFSPRYV